MVKPLEIKWTRTDSRKATKQGWEFFYSDGEHHRFEIEKVDECGRFRTDEDALIFVLKQALKGDRTAIKGILHYLLVDPQMAAADISNLRDTWQIIGKDTNGKKTESESTVHFPWDPSERFVTRRHGT